MASFTKSSSSPLSGDFVAQHWNERAKALDIPHARLRIIAREIAALPGPPATLLDIGCGAATLRKLLPESIEYFGVDIADDVIPVGTDPEHFVVADLNVEDDCFPGRTFDVVVASGAFEYVRDPERFLHLVTRKLAPGGFFVISYLNRWRYRDAIKRLRGQPPTFPDPHMNFISVPKAVKLLRESGFELKRSELLTRNTRVLPGPALLRHLPLSLLAWQFLFLCSLM
jgi:SAM-dependent methyltransferase